MSDTSDKITIRIAIDIPVNVAPATIKSIEPIVAKLTSDFATSETTPEPELDEVDELTLIARQEFDRKRKSFFAKAPRAYSICRRVRPSCDTALLAYKIITNQLGLDAPVAAEVLVQKQRKKLRKYIRARNQQTILRLATEGHKTKEICDYLGFKAPKVRLLLREARAKKLGGSDA